MRIVMYPCVNIFKEFLTKLMDVAGTGTEVQLPFNNYLPESQEFHMYSYCPPACS